MTVIAWDGKTLAVDRQGTRNGLRTTISKARRLESGEVLTGCGNSTQCMTLMEWYEHGKDPRQWPKFQKENDFSRLVVLGLDGHLYSYESLPIPIQVLDPFTAFGSGAKLAIGAMAMGANAVKAVEIASVFDQDCGLGVDSFEVTG